MMGEHARYNKGQPYETAAGVPMIIRYPNGIIKNKRIDTSYSSPDFVPTILSLMGLKIDPNEFPFQGIDGSAELLSDNPIEKKEQVRFMTDSTQAKWVAATDRQFKLDIGKTAAPYLFDLEKDPDEMKNLYGRGSYKEVTERLQAEIYDALIQYKFSLSDDDVLFFDRPFCYDSTDKIPFLENKVCADLTTNPNNKLCKTNKDLKEVCPNACGECCEDSKGIIWYKKRLFTCATIESARANVKEKACENMSMRRFCPITCKVCKPKPSDSPSISPSSHSPSSSPSEVPSRKPTPSPSDDPTLLPSHSPSLIPSSLPSNNPSDLPSSSPSDIPTTSPSNSPSYIPNSLPSNNPSNLPSSSPSDIPTTSPSNSPTHSPSETPSSRPSDSPSYIPSVGPSFNPSLMPSSSPSGSPTYPPSNTPSNKPSDSPSSSPSIKPSVSPSSSPSVSPTSNPSNKPSYSPTNSPSDKPSDSPSSSPSNTPTKSPSNSPTVYIKKPNLLVISSGEHNFRTLGCYRNMMDEKHSFIWGKFPFPPKSM